MLKDCISISGIRSKTTFNNRSSALLRDALKRCVGSIYHSSTSRSWMANGVLVEASMILEYPDCETEHFPKPKFDEAVTVRQLSSSLDQTSISGSIVGSFIETEEEEYRRNGTPSQEQDHNANLSDLLRSSQMSSIAKYRTLRNPEKQDDDLRASGITIGTDYFQEIQTWKGQETFTTWVCKLSLAIDERSVSPQSAVKTSYSLICNDRSFPTDLQRWTLFHALFMRSKTKSLQCHIPVRYLGYFLCFMMHF